MIIHDLKCYPDYFEAIIIGRKNFEVRKEDINEIPKDRSNVFREDDILLLREWWDGEYTGSVALREIIYVLRDFEGLQNQFVVLGLGLLPFDITNPPPELEFIPLLPRRR